MRGNPDMHYGAFTSYVIEEEGGKWFTNAYPWLKKKKENTYGNDYSRGSQN